MTMTPFAAGLLADLMLLLHVAIVAFAVFGQLLFMAGGLRGWAWVRKLWVRLAHLGLIAFVVLQSWLGQTCPSHPLGTVAAIAGRANRVCRVVYRALAREADLFQCAGLGVRRGLHRFRRAGAAELVLVAAASRALNHPCICRLSAGASSRSFRP
jgi:hypothetical protein